jgi:hypothetical protein
MAAAAPGRRRRVVVGHEAGWGGASGGRGERDGRVKGRVEQLGPGGQHIFDVGWKTRSLWEKNLRMYIYGVNCHHFLIQL